MSDSDKSYEAYQELLKLQFGVEPVKADPVVQQKLYDAINAGKVDQVKKLLDGGAHPVAVAMNSFGTPLSNAIASREPEIVKLLIAAGASPNDGFPHTPLCQAVQTGDAELVKTLIACGADLHHINRNPETPLQQACVRDHIEIVKILLDAGADPDFVGRKEKWETISNYSPIEYASIAGKKSLLDLLLKYSKNSDADRAVSVFIGAINAGDLATVKSHLQKYPDQIEKIDPNSGHTPLTVAAIRGRATIVKYLLSKGADVNAPAGKKADYQSPLIAAVCSGKLPIVEQLVKAGADLEYAPKAHPDWTALKYAKDSRLIAIAKYLENALKSAGKSASSPPPVGVITFDTNDAVILVKANVEETTNAFAEHLGKSTIKPNVYGKRIKLSSRCYGVFKIKSQPWSSIIRIICDEYRQWPRISHAAYLSEKLNCRVYFFANSDTAGCTQYVLLDNGKPLEYLEHGELPADFSTQQIVDRIKKIYQIDISPLGEIQFRNNTVFASTERKLDLKKPKNDIQLIKDYVALQSLYVPFLPEPFGASGETIELSLEGLGGDDIEQFDYISTKSSK